jgi:hypothetical protein
MVRSSVLGGKVLTRLDYAGNKWKTDFNVDGLLTAVQWGVSYASSSASIQWTHVDPQGLSEAGDTKAVYDPTGNYLKWQHAPTGPPAAYPPIASSSGGLGPNFGYAINSACILDGTPTDCSLALGMLAHRSAEQCPNNYCGADQIFNRRTGQVEMRPLTRDPDTGLLGYYASQPKSKADQPVAGARGKVPQNPWRRLSRDEISAMLDSLLSTIHNHKGCEDALNEFLGALKNETGYGAGKITDIIEAFRTSGIAYNDDRPGEAGHSGSGDAGTGLGGVPSVTFNRGGTAEDTAMTFMAEMIHWAGMPFEGSALHPDNHGYANRFPDPVLANVGYKLDWVMSADQFRRTYPETIRSEMEKYGRDFTESRLGHGAMKNKCLGLITGLLPKYARP